MCLARALAFPITIFASLLFACSSDTGNNNGGTDAEVADTGEPADSGMHPDAETPDSGAGPCDPLTGTGCPNPMHACVWVANTNQVQCRDVGAMPKAFEETCSSALLDCAPGTTCLQLTGEAGVTCKKVCDPANGMGCAGLAGASMTYSCTGLMNADYGVCVGGGTSCQPWMPDSCMPNETCELRGRMTSCSPAGMTPRGGNCAMADCQHDSICVGLQGEPNPLCYEACGGMNPMCSGMNDVCLMLGGVGFGICKTPMISCDPLNDMCPMNQVCSLDQPDVVCGPEGTTAIGGNCMTEPCARGGICVFLQGQANPQCYSPCSLQMPMCAMGNCGNIGLPFGICVN